MIFLAAMWCCFFFKLKYMRFAKHAFLGPSIECTWVSPIKGESISLFYLSKRLVALWLTWTEYWNRKLNKNAWWQPHMWNSVTDVLGIKYICFYPVPLFCRPSIHSMCFKCSVVLCGLLMNITTMPLQLCWSQLSPFPQPSTRPGRWVRLFWASVVFVIHLIF